MIGSKQFNLLRDLEDKLPQFEEKMKTYSEGL